MASLRHRNAQGSDIYVTRGMRMNSMYATEMPLEDSSDAASLESLDMLPLPFGYPWKSFLYLLLSVCDGSFMFLQRKICQSLFKRKVVVRWLGFALEFCCSQRVSIEHIKAETTAVDGSGLHRATSPPKNSVDMWMCTCLASAFWKASEDSNAQSHEVPARGNKTITTSTNAGPVVRPRIICGEGA